MRTRTRLREVSRLAFSHPSKASVAAARTGKPCEEGASAQYDHEHTAGAALGPYKMAAAPLALGKGHRGLALRDANRPKTTRVVGLEVTPDKAPTLRGVQPAVGFYAWATPHKKQ